VGVTTIRDCATPNSIAFSIRSAVEDDVMVGPRVYASGAGITTTGGHCWFCGVEADGELEVRRAVRAQKKAGADFIKVFATGGNATPGTNPLAPQYSKAEMQAVTGEADRLGMRVASHVHGLPGIHTSIAARVTTIEHCSFLADAGPQYDPEQARIMAGEGIYASPTIFRGPSKFFSLDMKDIPRRFSLFLERQRSRFEIINNLVDQGVKIVAGSDAGVTFNEFSDYPGDLILFGEGTRLSPEFVLKSATSVAAEALGERHLGVVAPGKAADLLAVTGNPLENIRCLENTCLVVSRGKIVTEGRA
jgi:imidazolonepropionase-like amidohydrolase